eukprot:ANDGO_06455.mRNA.1 hypothetical protein
MSGAMDEEKLRRFLEARSMFRRLLLRGLRAAAVFSAGVGILAYTWSNKQEEKGRAAAAATAAQNVGASSRLVKELREFGYENDDGSSTADHSSIPESNSSSSSSSS